MEVNRGDNGDEGEANEQRSKHLSGSENTELWLKLSGQEAMPLQPKSTLLPVHSPQWHPPICPIQRIPIVISCWLMQKNAVVNRVFDHRN